MCSRIGRAAAEDTPVDSGAPEGSTTGLLQVRLKELPGHVERDEGRMPPQDRVHEGGAPVAGRGGERSPRSQVRQSGITANGGS